MRLRRLRLNPDYRQEHNAALKLRQWAQKMQGIEYKGGVCVDCGYFENLNGLEFDHIMPKGKRALGQLWGGAWEVVKAELDRCELVCSTCHSIRTADRRATK